MKGKLYLIPSLLGDTGLEQLNPAIVNILPKLKYFFVENVKSARRFLKKVDRSIVIDDLVFYELSQKDENIAEQMNFLNTTIDGNNVGLLSDAGLPAIADPGENVILLAHQMNIKVVPLVGASSILLALMASGLNGEQFAFHGYLPIQKKERQQSIKKLEMQSLQNETTQIFMETPYRNQQIMEAVLKTCKASTFLCVACNLTTEAEIIQTKTIEHWKKTKYNFHKQPAVFVLQA